ncbi:hypothetical protein JXA56_04455 [Candidatus Micrarchaeota archaeon]|nr:hypothetical protein [Candidatus Micrarchaeota archaeon]
MRNKIRSPNHARRRIREPLIDDLTMIKTAKNIINRHSQKYEIDLPALVEELKSYSHQRELLIALLEVADEIMQNNSAAIEKSGRTPRGTAKGLNANFKFTDGYMIVQEWALQSEQIMKTIVEMVTEGDEKIRLNSVFALLYMGDQGTDISRATRSLEYALFDMSKSVRDCACMALGNVEPTKNGIRAVLEHLYSRQGELNTLAAETLLIWINAESNLDFQKRMMVYSKLVEKLRKTIEIPKGGLLPDEFYLNWMKKEIGAEDPANDN